MGDFGNDVTSVLTIMTEEDTEFELNIGKVEENHKKRLNVY